MKTVNSISGGKTSSYIAKHYPADYNVFALVRTEDKSCLFPDAKIRQEVSDRIGKEFIGTLEEDAIIYTMLDLEQFIGSKIDWVTGNTFDEVVTRKNGKTQLPTPMRRFCTVEMKIEPIFNFWKENIKEVVETRIGFRANETRRANTMIERCESTNGVMTYKTIVGKSKNGKRNKWSEIPYQIPRFPLIEDNIYKDKIVEYWKDKPNKMNWFVETEKKAIQSYKNNVWRSDTTYEKIGNSLSQIELFDTDFNDCDSGYCGI